jgi:hypothetical protein
MKSSSAWVMAACSIFLTAIFWIVLRVLLGGLGSVFRIPMMIMTASFAMLPLAAVIIPLAAWSLSVRSGHESMPLHQIVLQKWKHATALFLYALGIAICELLLGVVVAVWCGIEAIPVFGGAIYLFFSWVPTIVTLFMGILLFLHCVILLSVGAMLAQVPSIEQQGLFSEIKTALCRDWVIRFKLLFLGTIPTIIFYSATTIWTMKGLPRGIEFCSSIFRSAAFSALEAPLFLFLIHMAVEADRYIQWLSTRRVG